MIYKQEVTVNTSINFSLLPLSFSIIEQHKYSDYFYKHGNFHSSKEIITLLEKVGFEVQEKKQTKYTLENKVQEINDGVGEGVFAIIKAIKR